MLRAPAKPLSTQAQPTMDPRDRLRLFGPIRPMPRPASLIERLLFG